MGSANYGHHDCIVLYPINILNYKHRTKTLPNYDKCYVPLLVVPYYEEEKITITIPRMKIKLHN